MELERCTQHNHLHFVLQSLMSVDDKSNPYRPVIPNITCTIVADPHRADKSLILYTGEKGEKYRARWSLDSKVVWFPLRMRGVPSPHELHSGIDRCAVLTKLSTQAQSPF